MRQFRVIDQIRLIDGVLKCKRPSGRSYQNAHFKQGDLDGACGAYSIAMVLNILGIFKAEEICSGSKLDKRTSEWKLIKALNEEGLYRGGLESEKIEKILSKNYGSLVKVRCITKESNIPEIVKECIDNNNPTIIGFAGDICHWVVAVGYIEEDDSLTDLLTLDPGSSSPTFALWNGILNLDKIPRKRYGYRYNSERNYLVDLDEAIIISKR